MGKTAFRISLLRHVAIANRIPAAFYLEGSKDSINKPLDTFRYRIGF